LIDLYGTPTEHRHTRASRRHRRGLRQARRQLEKNQAVVKGKPMKPLPGIGLDGEIDRLESLGRYPGRSG
jgi:hypothetical protein